MQDKFYNCDCIEGAQTYIENNSVDLIICDPPYGIRGDTLDKHYNRNEAYVLDGYVEVAEEAYPEFSEKWIIQAERILKPGGTIYIVSGYTNLIHILNALKKTSLIEVNHIIWKYNFGVYTKTKYISSHYHILFYRKPGVKHTFNTFTRYADFEKTERNRSLNYQDREDVWTINREYKPGKIKNKNELPTELLMKLIQYSSNPDDIVCDMFLGSFSTVKIAKGLHRQCIGFEKSKTAFEYQINVINNLEYGYLISSLRKTPKNILSNRTPISQQYKEEVMSEYGTLKEQGYSKKKAIEYLSEKFGRGYWSLLKIIDNSTNIAYAIDTGHNQNKLF